MANYEQFNDQYEQPAASPTDQLADPFRLPPRSFLHPSERGVWTRRFYQLLVLLFIILLISLFLWGKHTTSTAAQHLLYNNIETVIYLYN